MKLPSWNKSKQNLDLGVGTPLERFIHTYEPINVRDALVWRADLDTALNYAIANPDCGHVGCVTDSEGQVLLTLEQEPE